LAVDEEVRRVHALDRLAEDHFHLRQPRHLRALREALADVAWSIREVHCQQEWRDAPLHAITVLIERLLAFGPDDTPQARRDLLWAYLSAYHAPFCDKAYPLIEALLGIGEGPPALPSERLMREAVAVLLELFGDAARRQPLLLVVEDIHWADAATLELLSLAATHGADLPVLSIYTTRPDRPLPDWLAGAERLELAPLDKAAMTRLVEEAEAGLADDTVRTIVARAEGVPLIGEELARYAAEDRAQGVPPTLEALFAARLDAAGSARRLAQLAATLGREVDPELLRTYEKLGSVGKTSSLC
jgi:predicted ATPase